MVIHCPGCSLTSMHHLPFLIHRIHSIDLSGANVITKNLMHKHGFFLLVNTCWDSRTKMFYRWDICADSSGRI